MTPIRASAAADTTVKIIIQVWLAAIHTDLGPVHEHTLSQDTDFLGVEDEEVLTISRDAMLRLPQPSSPT